MDERELLEEYVARARLLQLATVSASGAPSVCTVWYVPELRPDRLRFVSRRDRLHPGNIRCDPAVAGAILDNPPEELGLTARGVSFTGRVRQLPGEGIEAEIAAFVNRWPRAAGVLGAMPEGASRMYEIAVEQWVLFDEQNFPKAPRREIAGR
ncbi:pyridoxamine 5'-phosphate oxidase family protein [Nocardia sp. CDC159]|uniref:Pyridoxamine 5'-phosphate oxidase family protein n=1 Tax=Nocardia pulmonis TaxID=2951408 RepID=A0A9X2E941_9NOCA|nr:MULTISPECIES: pyridoxamine 5'-phosphate oxidase family protein [Nocardia]MCM6776577.1 pyridoxamine 5'-phosphate oxidase family protein [Nocardia pulmonis]MCM6789001.1 pyridoxamine 5'-phosphate oxidase family protein [Nocardia sp. CDC159]